MTGQLLDPPAGASLPVAATTRWQPLRTGLVDIFHYDYQEFWFRDGRVLFRGNNGTGKSKVLALTLPFLLDGDLSPSRVEPDGDREKKMEWNLLLGGKYEERIGYTWLEFGRVAEDGERLYLTVGCGLRAARGRGIADRWFFVTSQRLGQDLFLIGSSGTVLTRDRLTDAIGASGQVTQRAEQYRRMLDEHLFHLGSGRYDALVNLLIQLRQPQLSKRPDEGRLSQALTEALAPLDQAVLSDIAAAFHDLEQQRDELAGLRDTGEHVRRFGGRYRRYAAVAARRQARVLRTEHSGYEQQQRDLAEVRDQISQAAGREHAARSSLDEASTELAEQNAAKDELAGDPRLKNLDDAVRHADEASAQAEQAAASARRGADIAAGCRERRGEAANAADSSQADVSRAAGSLRETAAAAGIDPENVLAPLALPDGPYGRPETDAARQAMTGLADRRAAAVAHVTELAQAVAAREQELHEARRRLSEQEAARDAVADKLTAAQRDLDEAAAGHVAEWRGYAGRARALGLPNLILADPDEIGLAAWAENLEGPHPAERALREAAGAAQRSLAQAAAAAEHELAEARQALAVLDDERARLESGETDRPPAPYTRSDGARDHAPGAALWQVTDFAPGLTGSQRAGLEAALETSGLLDAWLTPHGRLLDAGTHDVIALPGEPARDSLARYLVPSIDNSDAQARALAAERIVALLSSVSAVEVADGPYATCEGRWRLGPLHGSWHKDHAAYVGHGAREEARRRRLAELAALIAAAKERADAAAATVDRLAARQAELDDWLAAAPSDSAMRSVHAAVLAAASALEEARQKADDAATDVGWAERDLAQAAADRDAAAADTRCPADLASLRAAADAVTGYRQAVTELASALRLHAAQLAALGTWTQEAARAEEEVRRLEEAARQAGLRAAEERRRLEELRASIGASVDELKERLEWVRARIAQLTAETKRLDGEHRAASEQRARGEGRAEQLAQTLAEAQARRDHAVADLRRFAGTGLLASACETEIPDLAAAWAADPAVRLARRVEQALADVDDGDDAWRRIQEEISSRFSELAEALTRHGHEAFMNLDDWLVVTIAFRGVARTPAELSGLLADEISYREQMLTARQRQVIEDHLINDVASHLQQLITDAEAQVAQMNSELRDRPTSTGMLLRLRWEVRQDGPAGLEAARARLLRQDSDLWSPADREAVGDFLSRQIEAARAEDEHATWAELLGRALDYRYWHRFAIERQQDGRWRSATGPASGGERVLTVSVPLFAAASAHYRSAHPHAPRLIMLDEAFAGVDDSARGQFLGLLAAFDLDVAMTSEREWGFYASVPGIATHHLVRRDGIDAVHVTTWEWDGKAARQVQRPLAGQVPAQGASPGEPQLPGLSG
ncbi:MAG TPA: TIGR02680 family protein [Streptosporangiaceae bacterium]|nr:TIGR02680 family protein [Streptosporangiaceae bacterium]